MSVPRAEAFRLVGPAAAHSRGRLAAPGNARFEDDAAAYAVALGAEAAADARAIACALPAPEDLAPGTLVVVLPVVVEAPSLASRFRSVLGRTRTIPRAERCTALLARGYVRLGAAEDAASGHDLAWGWAP